MIPLNKNLLLSFESCLFLGCCCSFCSRRLLRSWLCSRALNFNVRDLHRVRGTAVVPITGHTATARHAGNLLHQLHTVVIALAKDGIAAVGSAAAAHASVGVEARIEEGNFLLCN